MTSKVLYIRLDLANFGTSFIKNRLKMKYIYIIFLVFIGITVNSCYLFRDTHKKYTGISPANIELLVHPSDTIIKQFIGLKCQIINNKDIDIAFLPFYQEITTVTDYRVYIWFANILFKENLKNKVLLNNFFGDLNLPETGDYILIKPGESMEINLNIDFSQLDDEEFSKEEVPNMDYGEYEIILWYNDHYMMHPNAINDKVISNPIKIIYQKD